MKHLRLMCVGMIVAGLIMVGTAAAQTDRPNAPAAAIGTAFTYQGQIKRNGALFTGTCDFHLSLWDDAALGAQQGTTLSVNTVPVDNGVFAVELDFGNQFKGEARWLEPEAKCADDAAFTTLPRVALNAAPYASGLLPGAQMEGSIAGTNGILRASNNGEGAALVGLANSTTGTTYGVLGNASSPNGYAVWGYSNNNATAVRGFAADGGRGVWGSSLTWQGVLGESRDNAGVVGTSTNFIGVWGETAADNNTGVVGWAKDPCPAGSPALCYQIHPRNSAGVTGHALAKGAGVLGQSAEGNGVYGEAQTDGYGVQGHSASGVSVAGFSTGYDKTDLNGYGFGTPAAMFGGPNGVIGYSKAIGGNGISGVGTITGSTGVEGYNFVGGVGVKGLGNQHSGTGVSGQSDTGTGVRGQSDSGPGVVGSSSTGYAMQAQGNTTQDLNANGWVKAMVYVDPNLPTGQQIVRCFNSQLPAASATTPPCGMTVYSPFVGDWRIDFGFDVSQRFAVVSVSHLSISAVVGNMPNSYTQMYVSISYTTKPPEPTNDQFFLILY